MDTETPTTETAEQPKSASLLAQEVFGQDYYGEVEPEQTEEHIAPDEQVEESAQEASDEVEAEAEESEEAETAEPEEKPISSFSELAEHLETDSDWLESLTVKTKVNGEDGEVSIGQMKASYQMQEAVQKSLDEAKAIKQEAKAKAEQFQETIQEKLAIAASLIEGEKNQLAQEESAVNWDQLKRIDPAEYSAKKLDFQERKAALEAKIQNAAKTYQESIAQNQEKLQQEQQQYIQREQEALYKAIPEWKDETKAKAEKSALSEYLVAQGMTGEEVGSVTDHRLVLIARKAMLYDQAQQKSEPQKKRLLTIPKVLKPGASQPAGNSQQTEIARLQKKLRETGDLEIAYKIKQLQKAG